jgi:hypothetical protein
LIVNWRGVEYEYHNRVLDGGKERTTRYSNIDSLIFAADTESVQLVDRYEPQCFTLSDPFGTDSIDYMPENVHGLQYFLSYLLEHYGEELLDQKDVFMYFHNLEYDWLQLIKNDPTLLEMARIGVGMNKDWEMFRVDDYRITLKKGSLFRGSSPHFILKIQKGRKKFNLVFRDSFSFFPSSLAKVAKDLGMEVEKMERQEDLGQIDYRNAPPSEDKIYFEKYAMIDARVTRLAGEQIRELHRQADMTKLKVSAPSFGINMLLQQMEEGQKIMSGVYDQRIMQLVLDTYRGGRTGGIYHGKVENMSVLDFHSSYPASMLSLPSFSPSMGYIDVDDLRLENVVAILEETGNAFLKVSGVEHDECYPSLITTHDGKLTPIYGEFKEVATTGVELLVGIKSGKLEITEVHEMIVLLDVEENPKLPFKEFSLLAYERKRNSEKGSVEYASAKLGLNAPYGKLIESRSQTFVGASDGKIRLPFIEGMDKEFAQFYYEKYVELMEKGSNLSEGIEAISEELTNNFPEDVLQDMKYEMFENFSISGRVYGRYVVPAAASLITATSRARLLAAMKALDALYWDTDSVFVQGMEEEEIKERLLVTRDWLPSNVVPVQLGEELGEMDIEIKKAKGFLAGVKRYYLEDQEGKTKGASHGIPALPRDQVERAIELLATGENVDYMSKPKPMKSKESKTPEEIGSFKSLSYSSKFKLDDRLEWIKTGDGWIGRLKEFKNQDVRELSEEEYQKHLENLFKVDLAYDDVKEQIKIHGFIQIPKTYYREEYKNLSRSAKIKYFRRKGIALDQFCEAARIDVEKLFQIIGG